MTDGAKISEDGLKNERMSRPCGQASGWRVGVINEPCTEARCSGELKSSIDEDGEGVSEGDA